MERSVQIADNAAVLLFEQVAHEKGQRRSPRSTRAATVGFIRLRAVVKAFMIQISFNNHKDTKCTKRHKAAW